MHSLTRHKETPPPHLLTHPTQLLQLKQLPNRTPPARQEDLMTTPVQRRRPLLEARVVSRDTAEVIPDPLQELLGLFDTAERRRMHVLQGRDIVVAEGAVSGEKPRAHDQDVAEFHLCVLVLEDRFQPLEFYRRALEALEGAHGVNFFAGAL